MPSIITSILINVDRNSLLSKNPIKPARKIEIERGRSSCAYKIELTRLFDAKS